MRLLLAEDDSKLLKSLDKRKKYNKFLRYSLHKVDYTLIYYMKCFLSNKFML